MTEDTKCAYRNCENTYTDEVPFYFPTTDIRRRRIWLKNAGNDSLNSLTFKTLEFRFICAKHFPDEYIRRSSRIRLVKHAVPVHYITGDIEPGDDPYKMPQDESTTEIENVKYRKAYIKPSKCLIKALVNHTDESKNKKTKPPKINSKKFNSLKKTSEKKIQYNPIQYQVPVRIAPKRAAEDQKDSEETQKKICETKEQNTMTNSSVSYATGILPTMPLLMPKMNAFVPIAPKIRPAEKQKDLEETQDKNCKPKEENMMTTSCFSYATGILPPMPMLIPKMNAFVPIAPKKGPAKVQNDSEETQKKMSKPKEKQDMMTTSCFSNATGILPTMPLLMPKMKAFVPIAPKKGPAVDQNDSEETQNEICKPKEQENTMMTFFSKHATRMLRTLPPWRKVQAISDMLTILVKYKMETKGLKTQEDSADRLLIDLSLLPNQSKVSQLEGSNNSDIKPQIKPELEEPMIKTEPGLSKEPETEFEIEIEGVAIKSEAKETNMKSEPMDVQVKIEDKV